MPRETLTNGDPLHQAIDWCDEKTKDGKGVKQKGGKQYLEVKYRVEGFRRFFGFKYGIETELLFADEKFVRVKATICDMGGRVIGSGFAEERRGSNLVNTTSAVENAETSAIGRALASLGLHGGEYASANEMDAVQRKTHAAAAVRKKPEAVKPKPAKPKIKALPWRDALAPNVWVDDHIDGLENYATVEDLQSWAEGLADDLNRLEQADAGQCDRLFAAFNNRLAAIRNET